MPVPIPSTGLTSQGLWCPGFMGQNLDTPATPTDAHTCGRTLTDVSKGPCSRCCMSGMGGDGTFQRCVHSAELTGPDSEGRW